MNSWPSSIARWPNPDRHARIDGDNRDRRNVRRSRDVYFSTIESLLDCMERIVTDTCISTHAHKRVALGRQDLGT
jgi:hypothetical protein